MSRKSGVVRVFLVKYYHIESESTIQPLLHLCQPIRCQVFCTLTITRLYDHPFAELFNILNVLDNIPDCFLVSLSILYDVQIVKFYIMESRQHKKMSNIWLIGQSTIQWTWDSRIWTFLLLILFSWMFYFSVCKLNITVVPVCCWSCFQKLWNNMPSYFNLCLFSCTTKNWIFFSTFPPTNHCVSILILKIYGQIFLTHIRRMLHSYRNQPIYLPCRTIDRFLYEFNIGLIWVKSVKWQIANQIFGNTLFFIVSGLRI